MRISPGGAAIGALLVGFLVGAGAMSLHPPTADVVLTVADPIGTMWVNAIRMTVIPLVVSLLITGVASVSDVRIVGRLGLQAVLVFVVLLCGVAVLGSVIVPPVYSLLDVDPSASAALRERIRGAATAIPELPSFTSWVTGIVPVNPVKSAVDAAMLPLIVFSVSFALALTRLDASRRDAVLAIFKGTGDAMLVLVRWLLLLSPLGVFALAASLGARMGLSAAGVVGFYLVSHALLLLLTLLLLYPVAAAAGGISMRRFARAVLPAQVVAMGTRSSMSALPALLDGAERELRLPRAVSGFALPLAVSTFRLNQGVSWLVMAMFLAKLYGVTLGVTAVATLAIAAVAMSFSIPGIPSGGLFVIAPFYVAVGIPAEGIGILIALDTVPDVFKTLVNVTGHMTSAVVLARHAPADT